VKVPQLMVRLHSGLHPLTVDKVLEQLNVVSFQLLPWTLKMGGAVSVQQQRTPPNQSWLCTCECRLIRESGGCAAGACMHANSSASKAKPVSEAASPSLPFSLRSSFFILTTNLLPERESLQRILQILRVLQTLSPFPVSPIDRRTP
jgi:hypothetical protein